MHCRNILKNRWRRRYKRELKLNIPSTGYLSEELSEEEVFFDRTAMGRNKKSFMATNPKSTPNAPPRQPKSAPVSSQSTDHETQEQIIWTLSETPKSTPLMAVPTLTENMPSTEVWTVNEIPESQSLDSSSKESSSLVLLPAASDELVCTVSIATDSTSSFTESCKAPVAPRHEVVISIDDDDDEETIYTSEKSQCEKWNTVKDADKGTNREVAIRMEPDDGKDRSLLLSESESPGVLINTSVKLETNNLNTDDAVIDIRSREDENEELLAVNDNSKDGKSTIVLLWWT